MLISSCVSNTCLFAPAPYHKLNKGFFLGFLFKPRGGHSPPSGLNRKSRKSILYLLLIAQNINILSSFGENHFFLLFFFYFSFKPCTRSKR